MHLMKALKFSKTLKLSEDDTKVSRITPFRPKSQEEVDLCTVYVVRIKRNWWTQPCLHINLLFMNRNDYHPMLQLSGLPVYFLNMEQ